MNLGFFFKFLGEVMGRSKVLECLHELLAHGLFFCFTLLVPLKIDQALHCAWWVVFVPLWLFHLVVARGRFSVPAPLMPRDRDWAPFHALMATPLLVAFELLLCIHLDNPNAVSLKIVFFPLFALEIAILFDNVRMCKALMPSDDERNDKAICESLPHFWVAIAMVFFIAATAFTLAKISGDFDALGWWDLYMNFCVGQFFAFILCTRWYNPAIHRHSGLHTHSFSTTSMQYLKVNSGFLASVDEDDHMFRLQEIGSHVMKLLVLCFQILLTMHLAGTPPSARFIPVSVLFIPLFLLQGAGILFSVYILVETIIVLVNGEAGVPSYFRVSSIIRDSLSFLRHGTRFVGWWSIDEGSREEQARLYYPGTSGSVFLSVKAALLINKMILEIPYCTYDLLLISIPSLYNTFAPPDTVKKMPRAKLAEEIRRLQAALCEQSQITHSKQEEFERFQNEKILCRICFDCHINILLLPCRHHILCSTCSEKCKKCPICRMFIEERLPVLDV